MHDDREALSADDLVEYCRTQAGLLSGRVETIGAETDALLDEIDEDIAAIRTHLTERTSRTDGPTVSSGTTGPNDARDTLAELEDLETELEEKQALAEAKRARMAAFQDLAADYIDVAEELASTVESGREALERVVRFERDHDAPTYFDDRQTVLEAAGADGAPNE